MNFLVAKVVITGSFILHGTGNRNGTGTLNEGFIYYALTVLTIPDAFLGIMIQGTFTYRTNLN